VTLPAVVIHGGAGNPRAGRVEDEAPYHEALLEALAASQAHPGDALSAVEAAVRVLEDAPVFNAGRGSVLTSAGTVEMDAAVMSGADLRAGAVAVVRTVRNPVSLARAVMESSDHVLLVGEGAEQLAAELGMERMEPEWFVTDSQRRRLARDEGDRKGTVGAVALDTAGRLAAATSTGGTRGQRPGRVGDSPIIGAGTYADSTCAVSATGDGEHIMGAVAAHEISAVMRYRGLSVEEACEAVLRGRLEPLGAEAGLIAIDAQGRIAMPFNTAIMHRGWQVAGEEPQTAVGP
jgi:isoaspartyl peptidase/L-asparaginase-like protein (Ntn-hydrolase superfamily)